MHRTLFKVLSTTAIVIVNVALIHSTEDEDDEEKISKAARKRSNRKKKVHRSTSSDSGAARGEETMSEDAESLDLSDSLSNSDSGKSRLKKFVPASSAERPGWRKWHRKCKRCPEDAKKKWRDPTIKWICGAYQRARRSFKSACMMEYRNCQDGTMFVKLHNHRCKNETGREEYPHGDHFFYEYKVKMSGDSSESKVTSSDESSPSSSTD